MNKQFNIGCGLINRRQNCFMNAVLQALFRTPKIAQCLQRDLDNARNCKIRSCISCMVVNLYGNITSSKLACSPYQLYGSLKKTDTPFSQLLNGAHQDAHEFLIVFNDVLEKQPHSVRWFANNFTVDLATHIVCGSCGKVNESSSKVTDLALYVAGNRCIQSAVDSYFDHDDIQFRCNACRSFDIAKKKHFIVSAPAHLCLQLRRFSDRGKKLTNDIEISSGLRINKHFLKAPDSESKYKLIAVINHFGESRNVGHYNTIVLTANGEHVEFDDHNVRRVSSNLVSGKDAYILFYEQVEESLNRDLTSNDQPCPYENDRSVRSATEIDDGNEIETSCLQNPFQMDGSTVVDDQLPETKSQNLLNQDCQKKSGRRIVDVDYLLTQMTQLGNYICQKCESGKLVYTEEIRRGLKSSFVFICKHCGNLLRFNSCPTFNDAENINTSAVLGTVAVGQGFYHLQEFLAHLNVPAMSYVTFHRYEEHIQNEYLKLSKQFEAEALAEEKRLAIEMNDVDSARNALIPVEFDGSWEKRSYTTNFSSLAGCAAIIGLRTKQILYSDTKQKYCHICQIAKSKGTSPRSHNCRKNYEGPSSGMETQIIIEGFKFCAEKGARFNKFVGDGDSSTYKALRDLQIYKDPYIMIEKFECVSHLFRNFLKQFKVLIRSSKLSIKGRKFLTLETGINLCKGIRLAAKHWRESNVDLAEKYDNLEKNIMNAFQHYLGIHDDCASYFCEKSTSPGAVDTMKILKETGMYYEVMDLCQKYFGNNVKSLVAGLCTNKTEGFNSLIAKTIGGKRICNSLAGSYKLRTNIASVQYNSGGHSGSKIQELLFDVSNPVIKKIEADRKRKCYKNTIAKENRPKNFQNDEPASKKKKRNYYADGHEDLDMTNEKFEVAKTRFLQRLLENKTDRLNIEIETRAQPHSFRWIEIRKLLLTSSYFGRILNVRSKQSYSNIVEEIVYKNIQYANTAEMRHQRIYEKEGLRIFNKMYQFDSIRRCGIFIDENLSFLGATPLRIYGDNGIVVVKCPKKEFGKSMKDAIKTISFWAGDYSNRTINKKSHWFYEIQGQLHITKKQMAYLVIYLGNEVYEIIELKRNDAFWDTEMEKKLCYFYNEALLKELIDPRDARSMKLRQYNTEKDVFE